MSLIDISQGLLIRIVLAWPTRLVWVELVSASNDVFPGWYLRYCFLDYDVDFDSINQKND